MAQIVLALGVSHTPMTSSPHELWAEHARIVDANEKALRAPDGNTYDYDTLVKHAGPEVAELAKPVHYAARYDRCQKAIARVAREFERAAPDVAIIVGEDQHEQFFDDHMPALLVYWGETIRVDPYVGPPNAPPTVAAAAWSYGTEKQAYPVAADLGRHLIETLVERDFDVSASRKLPRDRGIGHAFAFVYQRVMNGRVIPHVPVMLNTYYPPNTPGPGRCYQIGRALRSAVESWPSDLKVAIIASGGLSHFVVNEELDRRVLDAMGRHDEAALRGISRADMVSGTSEILNWIAVAGAAEKLDMEVIDYIPAYRSPAGTGVGLAFSVWK